MSNKNGLNKYINHVDVPSIEILHK